MIRKSAKRFSLRQTRSDCAEIMLKQKRYSALTIEPIAL